MKPYYLFALILLAASASAQNVAINNDASLPHASAILDIKSISKGLLIPRLTTDQRTALASPAKGLMVMDTTLNSLFYYNGSSWGELSFINSNLWVPSENNIYNTNPGNIGIGTSTPNANAILNIYTGSSLSKGFLINGTYNAASTVPNLSTGSRLMFFPGKAAFRAGYANNADWNDLNVGHYSVALGYTPLASGARAVAMGNATNATGDNSTALGSYTTASNNSATSFGYQTTASGERSTAMGYTSTASGNQSFSVGLGTIASDDNSFAQGEYSIAGNNRAFATGNYSLARGLTSTAMGSNTIAAGRNSTAIGTYNIAKGYSSLVIGMYNDSLITSDESSINTSTALFVIGNGSSDATRSNALVVQKNGNVAVGTNLPSTTALLHVNTDSSLTKGFLVTGAYQQSGSLPNLGAGTRMMFYPAKSAYRAGTVTGSQWNNSSVGQFSFASGYNTVASGKISTATGNDLIARGYSSSVIGMFNDPVLASAETSSNASSPVFIVGNGDDDANRTNAMVVRKDGRIGIGTNSPATLVHINAGGNFNGMIVTGQYSLSGIVPDLGAGSRIMFFPGRAAFRAGRVTGDQWDNSNVGVFSVALGNNTKAVGVSSFASGESTNATADFGTAMGFGSFAEGTYSTALGYYGRSGGDVSTVMGVSNEARGYSSTVVGIYNNSMLGARETSISPTTPLFIVGNGAFADRSNAFLVKKDGKVYIDPSDRNDGTITGNALMFGTYVNTGEGIASKRTSGGNENGLDFFTSGIVRMKIINAGKVGIGLADPIQEFGVDGRMNIVHGVIQRGGTAITGTSDLGLYSRVSGHYLRFVTNGGDMRFYSDDGIGGTANLVIQSGGNIGIGTTSPSQKLHVVGNICYTGTSAACSDMRYKTSVVPMGKTLPSVLSLHPIYYNWNQEMFKDKGFSSERQIGFSAQEIEVLFPEVVQTDHQGYKAVDYGRLTTVLVQAIKEQQEQIEELKTRLEKIEKRL